MVEISIMINDEKYIEMVKKFLCQTGNDLGVDYLSELEDDDFTILNFSLYNGSTKIDISC